MEDEYILCEHCGKPLTLIGCLNCSAKNFSNPLSAFLPEYDVKSIAKGTQFDIIQCSDCKLFYSMSYGHDCEKNKSILSFKSYKIEERYDFIVYGKTRDLYYIKNNMRNFYSISDVFPVINSTVELPDGEIAQHFIVFYGITYDSAFFNELPENTFWERRE